MSTPTEGAGPYEGQITIDAELLHALWCYGNLSSVEGVIYQPGSHQECLAIVDRIFSDRASQPIAPAPEAQLPKDLPADTIAAVVGGGVTSYQVVKIWGLIRAALLLRNMTGSSLTGVYAAPPVRSAATSATHLLNWLSAEANLELSFERWEEDGRWQVLEIRGGRNDQEWSLLGRGDTPEQALSAAKLALHIRRDAHTRHDRASEAR